MFHQHADPTTLDRPGPAAARSGRPLRAGVVGAGKISEEYLRFLSASPRAELIGVCDLSPSLSRFAAGMFGTSSFTDLGRMLSEGRPDVVHVLTPTHTHGNVVSECLRADAHVIVEKPVATTFPEYGRLRSLARQCGRQLIEDHNYRFNEPVLAMKAMVEGGRLGPVCEVEVRMTLGLRSSGNRYSDPSLPHPSPESIPPQPWAARGRPARVPHPPLLPRPGIPARGRLPRPDRRRLEQPRRRRPVPLRRPRCAGALRLGARADPVQLAGRSGRVHDHGSGGEGLGRDRPVPALLAGDRAEGHGAPGPACQSRPDRVRPDPGRARRVLQQVSQKTPYEGLHRFLELTYRALSEDGPPPVKDRDIERASRLIDVLLDGTNRA